MKDKMPATAPHGAWRRLLRVGLHDGKNNASESMSEAVWERFMPSVVAITIDGLNNLAVTSSPHGIRVTRGARSSVNCV